MNIRVIFRCIVTALYRPGNEFDMPLHVFAKSGGAAS
jgi:hypothetical protein